jgi:hypothetical protein
MTPPERLHAGTAAVGKSRDVTVNGSWPKHVDGAAKLVSFDWASSSDHHNEFSLWLEVVISTRGIPRGPCRPPESLARQRFLEVAGLAGGGRAAPQLFARRQPL